MAKHPFRSLKNQILIYQSFFNRNVTVLERYHYYAGPTGLEPAISSVTGRRDNQLRYGPTRTPQLAFYACILYNSSCLGGDSDFQ